MMKPALAEPCLEARLALIPMDQPSLRPKVAEFIRAAATWPIGNPGRREAVAVPENRCHATDQPRCDSLDDRGALPAAAD